MAALDTTAMVSQGEKMLVGYINGAVWLFVWGFFSAWFGTTALAVGRRRLLDHVDPKTLPSFSTRLLNVYFAVLVFQLFIVGWCTVNAANETDIESQIFNNKVIYAARAVSMCFSQLYGLKVVIFDAAGSSIRSFLQGERTKLQVVAVFCTVFYAVFVSVNLVLVLLASSSLDPILGLPNLTELFLLDNLVYPLAWFAGMGNFGINLHHMVPWRSVDDTEDLLKQWKQDGLVLKLGVMVKPGANRNPRGPVVPI